MPAPFRYLCKYLISANKTVISNILYTNQLTKTLTCTESEEKLKKTMNTFYWNQLSTHLPRLRQWDSVLVLWSDLFAFYLNLFRKIPFSKHRATAVVSKHTLSSALFYVWTICSTEPEEHDSSPITFSIKKHIHEALVCDKWPQPIQELVGCCFFFFVI